ncbi:MAG: hypothetical protein ACM3Q1_08810 [Bacteroidales bacterium]
MRSRVSGFLRTAIVAAATMTAGTALAADPAALVLDYTGKPNPLLMSYNELVDGSTFALAANESVTLTHYKTCKTVRITGAKVTVSRAALTVTGGSQKEEPGQDCPKEMAVATKGVGGGLVVRAVAFHALPDTIDCAVVGKARAQVAKLEVVEDKGGVVLSVPVTGGRAVAPAGTAPLPHNKELSLVATGADGATLVNVPVDIEATVPGRACLIRVD